MARTPTADYILYDAFLGEIDGIAQHLAALRSTLVEHLRGISAVEYPIPDISTNLTAIVSVALVLTAERMNQWTPDQWSRYLSIYLERRVLQPERADRRHAGERALGKLTDSAQVAFASLGAAADQRMPRKYVRRGDHYNRKLLVAVALLHASEALASE